MKTPTMHRWLVLLALVFVLPSLACQFSLIDWPAFEWPSAWGSNPTPIDTTGTSPQPNPTALAQVKFTVRLPAPIPAGDELYLTVLDEVTGLPFNPQLYKMTPLDAQTYSVDMGFPLGSIVKYRYLRKGPGLAQEATTWGELVRYRLYHAGAPGEVQDFLAAWNDQPYTGTETGRIRGVITNAQNGQPIPNIMVSIAGVSTLSDSLGQYVLDGIQPGTHLLMAYALDGAFKPFQQGATAQGGAATPAPLALQAAPTVQVTFNLKVPTDTAGGAPIRLAGNLLQLGNTYADLGGGSSTVASRMPALTPVQGSATSFSFTLRLPVGADIRYKYTLGDGIWNAEHDLNGKFVLRQLIVPDSDTVISDTVTTWQAGPSAPIIFNVTVPANTPVGDTISIQFSPFGWTEPIPMWPLGNNRWTYRLSSPLYMLGSFGYRYCRNDQCTAAGDLQTAAANQSRRVSTSLTTENRQDTVRAWSWLPESDPATVTALPIRPRTAGFWTGVEFSSEYHPSWQAYYPATFTGLQSINTSIVVLTPTWTARTNNQSLNFAPIPGRNPLWADNAQITQLARATNLNVALYPMPALRPTASEFWLTAPRNSSWWEDWFSRYRAFALYHADLATQAGARVLILGGESIAPSLPGGLLANGQPSDVPADAESRWRNLIVEVRARFNGQLLWAHPYRTTLGTAPAFIDQFDGIYLLWSAPLAANGQNLDAYLAEANRRMDEEVFPFVSAVRKPVVIAVDYPSARGAAQGCIQAGGSCLDSTLLNPTNPDIPAVPIDLKGQADLYQAMLIAVEQHSWVSGFIARGYYPPVSLTDKSSSVRGKPAADLLWYWYPRFLGR
jgi:hypothetical protein